MLTTVIAASAAPARPSPRALTTGDVVQHSGRLLAVARGLAGSREEAEDLVQETLLAILRRPRRIACDDAWPYLTQALRNTWVSEHRRSARRPRCEPLPDRVALEAAADDLADAFVASEHARALLASLPPRFREVVVAVDLCGLSYDQAACALGVPPGTVMSRLFRARRRLAPQVRPV
jgi:RNA polymerase sigma-70 factor (ECF subfamily)